MQLLQLHGRRGSVPAANLRHEITGRCLYEDHHRKVSQPAEFLRFQFQDNYLLFVSQRSVLENRRSKVSGILSPR